MNAYLKDEQETMRRRVCEDVRALVVIRHGEIGDTRARPGDVVCEVAGLGWLVQHLEELLGVDWTWTEAAIEEALKTAVDTAATASRLSEAFRCMQLKRQARDRGEVSHGDTEGTEDGYAMEAHEAGDFDPRMGANEREYSMKGGAA